MLATERRPCIRRDEEAKDALRFGHEQNGECNQMDGSMASDGDGRLIAQYRKTATNFIDHDRSLSGDCCSKLDDSATPLPSPFKILVRLFEKNRINNHMASNHQAHPNLHLHHGPIFHTYDEPDAWKNVVHQHASIIHHHHDDPTPHQQNLWASKMMMRKMLSFTDQSGFSFGRLIQHQHRCGRAKQISCLSNVPSNNDCYISCLFVLLVIMLFTPACFCIKVVSLNVPSHVRRGSDLELSCLFDLGNATLYSLKWFYRAHEWDREEQEFFRFTPRHKPYKQVFPLEGIQVDLSKSSGSVVYIRQANSKTSGKYKCEISVEETFQTVAAEKLMTVFNSSFSRLNGGLSWNDHLITICLAFIAYNVYNNLLLTHSHVI